MPGLYDRLQDQLGDDDDQPTGLTPLDLLDLPEDQRRVMTLVLRDPQAGTGGVPLHTLQEKLSDLDTLAETLDGLVENNWLIVLGDPPNLHYKVNLRRKQVSKAGTDLWASLMDRLSDESPDSTSQGATGGE